MLHRKVSFVSGPVQFIRNDSTLPHHLVRQRPFGCPTATQQLDSKNAVTTTEGVISRPIQNDWVDHAWVLVTLVLPVMKVAGTLARSLSKASMCTAFFSSFETSNCPQGSRRIKIRTESSPQRSFDLEVFPVGDSLPHSQPQEKLP